MVSAPAFALTAMMVSLAFLAGIVLAVAVAALNRGGRREDATDPYDALVASRFTIPVSLIVPASGKAPGLSPAVGSLLSLNYPELEVIAVAEDLTENGFEHLKAEWDLETKEFFYRRTLHHSDTQDLRQPARCPPHGGGQAGGRKGRRAELRSQSGAVPLRRVHAAHDLPRFERTPAADVTLARSGHGSRRCRARRTARRRQHGRRFSVDGFRAFVDDDAPHVEPPPVRSWPARNRRRVATRRPSRIGRVLSRGHRSRTADARPIADLDDRARDRTSHAHHEEIVGRTEPVRILDAARNSGRRRRARCSSRSSDCRRSIAVFMDAFP